MLENITALILWCVTSQEIFYSTERWN